MASAGQDKKNAASQAAYEGSIPFARSNSDQSRPAAARQQPIFRHRSRLYRGGRKTMALKLGADRGQTRGQYPAPPPEQLELKGLISVRSILPKGKIPGLLRRGRNRIDGREEVPNCRSEERHVGEE